MMGEMELSYFWTWENEGNNKYYNHFLKLLYQMRLIHFSTIFRPQMKNFPYF